MQPPEDRLLARLRQGEPEAWTAFVARTRRMVHAVGYRITGNASDAEEVLQEAFLAFSRALPRFRGDASPSTFLYRIAVNAALRLSQANARLSGSSRIEGNDLPERKDTEDPAEREEVLKEVRAAVLALPLQQRAVFTLRHYENVPPERIAEILDLAPGTVKAHLHQAVLNLRERLRYRVTP